MLEILLAMAFAMLITWSEGTNNKQNITVPLDRQLPSETKEGDGLLDGLLITVTSGGFLIDGKLYDRESLKEKIQSAKKFRLYIHPDQETMNANLRWLLNFGMVKDEDSVYELNLAL